MSYKILYGILCIYSCKAREAVPNRCKANRVEQAYQAWCWQLQLEKHLRGKDSSLLDRPRLTRTYEFSDYCAAITDYHDIFVKMEEPQIAHLNKKIDNTLHKMRQQFLLRAAGKQISLE